MKWKQRFQNNKSMKKLTTSVHSSGTTILEKLSALLTLLKSCSAILICIRTATLSGVPVSYAKQDEYLSKSRDIVV